MSKDEKVILEHINTLKDLREECEDIASRLVDIISEMGVKHYDKETPPNVEFIVRAIDEQLMRFRAALCEERGE